MHVVLVQPEIAGNTGAIIRLCANTGCDLHLVEPLGFDLDDRQLKRGGLDYHEYATVAVYSNFEAVRAVLPGRWFGFSSHAERSYADVAYKESDVFVFGSERAGLSEDDQSLIPADQLLFIPMRPGNRSLNLANAASIVVYEAWRQQDFSGAGPGGTGLTSETPGAHPFDH